MRFRFDCSGRYQSRVRLFLGTMRVREAGEFRASDGVLHLSRADGSLTAWRYRFDGSILRLEEAPGEWHDYRRLAVAACARPASPRDARLESAAKQPL
ncbi:MAG TPA: hypothetical protein VMT85_12175 [Thermoanaerobaculia bacterium]|nr:hypothetical protein [Thermoanaerobaculia bacterium]